MSTTSTTTTRIPTISVGGVGEIVSDPKDLVVSKQVRAIELGLYTDDDVRNRSVVEILSSQAYLNEQTPLPGGLYDPKLGPISTHDALPCPTCAGRYLSCPGHFGHIELCVPLYQPLLWNELLQVLRAKCFACHKLKPTKRSLLVAHAKLLLLQHHKLQEFHDLDSKLAVLVHTASNNNNNDSGSDNMMTMTQAQRSRYAGAAMETHLNKIIYDLENTASSSPPPPSSTYQKTLLRKYRNDLLKTWKGTPKCRHCGAFSPRIKTDQSNKIFMTKLSATQSRLNESENIVLTSATETLAAKLKIKKEKQNQGTDDNNEDGYDSEDTDIDETGGGGGAQDDEDDDDKMDVDNDEDDDDDDETTTTKKKEDAASQNYMHPKEVQAQCQLTWQHHGSLLTHALLGGGGGKGTGSSLYDDGDPKSSYKILFVQAIAVPPSRFRPPMIMGGMTVEHAQNHYLSKMITENAQVRQELLVNQNERLGHTYWIQLQTTFNCFIDSSKDPSAYTANTPIGIRQLLEKKEGIFRKHMMGKRVDSACRSVISPDPYIGTNEIGIPMAFARVLTYPTPVTEWNINEMRRLVERGPNNYPGARWVEIYNQSGKSFRVDLTKMSDSKRKSVAARLLSSSQQKDGNGSGGISSSVGRPALVGRQLRHGDTMLVNRQPTLHKPGIMAHQVRILHDPTQKTIRMHYANCNTYNADYDGDEMNCHFPQSDVARAEAVHIAQTDLQYIVPTDGSPLRGLIQDHVCGGVKLTMRDTFLKRWEYQQLLFATLSSLPRLEVLESDQDIQLVPPAILKPEPLWTGKQVITTLLLHLCNSPRGQNHSKVNKNPNMLNQGGISLERKSKMPESAFGAVHEEHLVLVRDGELLRGILDKSAFGSTDFSLVHGVFEAYGPTKAGLLLNSLGRLFTAYIQYYAGHSCRVEDLILKPEADQTRRDLVKRAYNVGSRACKAWADSEGGKVPIEPVAEKEGSNKPLKPVEVASASAKIGQLLGGAQGKENFAALDGYMMSQLNPLASEIVKKCLPKGLAVPFPANTFGLMTTTGAKGSIVNQSQVSCALGQQALEGRRVPRLNSGRTLPSFAPYDLNPRADGFVMDRFLTGVRPQEYYFHCMAGREGLVDTAVKTSRSGYLQRCLIKHLEELKVCYDYTVRNGEGGVVQFLYGEDALDPTKASYLDCTPRSFEFMARNHGALALQNTPLPGSTIEIAAADHDRSDALASNEQHSKHIQKGTLVLARRLRDGTKWTRGALCRGWHQAIVTRVSSDGEKFDLEYTKDKHRVTKVPISVSLGRCGGTNERAASNECLLVKPAVADPIVSAAAGSILTSRIEGGKHCLGATGACVSERVASAAAKALATKKLELAMKSCNLSAADVGGLVAAKFGSALCAPGEAVGSIAAQSVGEPSTQMTLNTFHLAGAGANVTLGIPRLREIIMTASKTLKTPTMSIPLRETVSETAATKLTRSFTKLNLMELIAGRQGVTVRETLIKGDDGAWQRAYFIILKLHPAERISAAFGLSLKDVATRVGVHMVPQLAALMKMELKRSATEGDISVKVIGSQSTNQVKESEDGDIDNQDQNTNQQTTTNDDLTDEEDNASGDEGGEEDGVAASKYNRSEDREASYGMGDEEDSSDGDSRQNDAEMQEIDSPGTPQTMDLDNAPSDGEVKIDKKTNSIILSPLRVDPSTRPLLMVGLVERAAERTLIRSRKNIEQAFVNKEEGRGRCLQTAGVNFPEFWRLDSSLVEHNGLMSNDTWAVRCAYGVEAARNNIVDQIRSVFGAYGIEVNPRHLTLIADYMTFEGGYKAMNRIGMEEMSSTLLQMSFETTAHFLTQAALSKTKDDLESPSANIVLGRPIRQGTGAFDLLVKT